jgi:hypothetical protein
LIRVSLPKVWELKVDRRVWIAVAVCDGMVNPEDEGELGEMARYLRDTFSIGEALNRFRLAYPAIFGGVHVMVGRRPAKRFEFWGYVKKVDKSQGSMTREELAALKDLNNTVLRGEGMELWFREEREVGYTPVDNIGLRFITDTPPQHTAPSPHRS